MKTLQDFNPQDKNILVRVDYNVPLKAGKVTNDLRIHASLPTIQYLLDHGAKRIILISHLGRPDGKTNLYFSLSPVADTLRQLLPDQKIAFYSLPKAGENVLNYSDCKIILLENLRFNPGEEENSEAFAKNLIDATGAEVFVQDGFAALHRAHASTDAITKLIPSYAGLLVEKEVKNLTKALEHPAHPFLLIVGGSKVADKQPLVDGLSHLADQIAIGGKIAADGYTSNSPKIYVADDFDENSAGQKLDIGPVSTAKIAEFISSAKTIIWNGLLGQAEDPAYATASTIIAEAIGTKQDATTIICGGDTAGFVTNLMEDHKNLHYSLISTGGGATLEFLLNPNLPGLKPLN